MGSVSVCWNTVDHAVSWNIYDFYWALKKEKDQPAIRREILLGLGKTMTNWNVENFLKISHFQETKLHIKYTLILITAPTDPHWGVEEEQNPVSTF